MELRNGKFNSLSRKILINSIFNVIVANIVVGCLIFYGAHRLSDKFLILSEKQAAKSSQNIEELFQENLSAQDSAYIAINQDIAANFNSKEDLAIAINKRKETFAADNKRRLDINLTRFSAGNKILAEEIRHQGNLSLFEIYFLLGIGILIILDVIWGVSRGVTIRVTRPIMELAEIAVEISKGQYKHEITLKSDDEIGLLSEAFQKMSHTITTRDEELEAINRNLENLVAERTVQLNEQFLLISGLLNNMKQAVFAVSEDRKVVVPVSKFAEELFNKSIVGKDIFDVVYSDVDRSSELFSKIDSALNLVFGESELQWAMAENKFPRSASLQLHNGVRSLKISYSPLWNQQDELEKLMYVVEDVTDILALEKSVDQEKVKSERNITIIQEVIATNFNYVLTFLDSFGRQMSEIQNIGSEAIFNVENIQLTKRNLHTIKGNARGHGLFLISNFVHKVESEFGVALKELNIEVSQSKRDFVRTFDGLISSIEHLRSEYTTLIDRTFNVHGKSKNGSNMVEVSKKYIDDIRNWLLRCRTSPSEFAYKELTEYCLHLLRISAKGIFERNIPMVSEVSARLAKQTELILECDKLSMSGETLELLNDGIGHLLRNSLDHAIESAVIRQAAGKSAIGRIVIRGERFDELIKIVISDDGGGMDADFIANRAIKSGIVSAEQANSMTTEEKLSLIFISGFSTKETVSDISGRGIGMDAVKAIITKLNGTIVVKSKVGLGTEIHIDLIEKFGLLAQI